MEDKLLKNNNENVNPMPSKSSRASKSSKSKKYKRENLTDIGNTILTSNIFADLIHNLTNRNYKINILYIVDDEFDIEMVETFSKCLSLDEKIIEDNKKCKINLIFTQPDMALRDFIRENNTKNEKIKSLEQKIDENLEEIRKFTENIDYMNKRLLSLLILVHAVMMPMKLWAQEPYAVLSENNTVLTLYYDSQKGNRQGAMAMNPDGKANLSSKTF